MEKLLQKKIMKGFIFTNFIDFVEKSNGLEMVDQMLSCARFFYTHTNTKLVKAPLVESTLNGDLGKMERFISRSYRVFNDFSLLSYLR